MDFLDPRKKRAHAIKLTIGHFLMVVLVLVGTFILVFQAYGFDVNRKTGEVIQNGLVFVDSAPDGAEIKLNGVVQKDQTNNRLALPDGKYDLEINKSGYRTWKKSFELRGGSVERFAYPTLFANDLPLSEIQSFDTPPSFMTQSPDRRWVLLGQKDNLTSLIQYDLNTLKSDRPVRETISLPEGLFTPSKGNHSLTLLEWSSDNENFLIRHNYKGGQEFVVVNRDAPLTSFNINTQLEQNPNNVALHDKGVEQLYMHNTKTKTLTRVAVASKRAVTIASNVLNFEPHGKDVIIMAVVSPTDPKKTQIIIQDGAKSQVIREIPTSSNIHLAIARYDSEWHIAVHDPSENKTYIYKNPVEFIARQPDQKPAPTMVLRSVGLVNDVSFSQNTQFIVVWSGQSFSVYDAEYARSFRFDIKQPFDEGSKVEWMDGHRLLARSGGKVLVFEFDGQNLQTLNSALPTLPVAFNRDYTELYGVTVSATSKKPVFTQAGLRLEEDK